jgi:hypothetical protein
MSYCACLICALHIPIVRLECVQIVADDADLRLGALQREPERQIIEAVEAVEDLAGIDALVLRDVDLLDDAGHVGGDADLVGFAVGVVRRHHLAAGDNTRRQAARAAAAETTPGLSSVGAWTAARAGERRISRPTRPALSSAAHPGPRAAKPLTPSAGITSFAARMRVRLRY